MEKSSKYDGSGEESEDSEEDDVHLQEGCAGMNDALPHNREEQTADGGGANDEEHVEEGSIFDTGPQNDSKIHGSAQDIATALPSLPLQDLVNIPPPPENSFSQEGAKRFMSADEAHETTVLDPVSLSRLGSEDSVIESLAAAEKEQCNGPMQIIGIDSDSRTDTLVKPLETVPTVTRCGGMTLHGYQCTHYVKDGSGFCLKHTKVNGYVHKKQDVKGSPAVAEIEQSNGPMQSTGNDLDNRTNGSVKPLDTVPTVTRCGGMTLHGYQCTHYVKDGSGFCVKHTRMNAYQHRKQELEGSGASNRGASYTPFKAADIIVFRCRGKTLHGTQCTHNVKDGAVYCLKHEDQAWGLPVRRVEDKTLQAPALAIPNDRPVPTQITSVTPTSPVEIAENPAGPRCIGRTRRTEEQCSFRPKSGSVFCERHARQFREKGNLDLSMIYEAPSSSSPTANPSLKRRRSQEGVSMAEASSVRDRRSLSKAKELYSDILNAGLLRGKAVSATGRDLVGWICEEATKDAASGETLLSLLSEEKERLREVLIKDLQKSSIMKPPHFWKRQFSPNFAKVWVEGTSRPSVSAKGGEAEKLQRDASAHSASDIAGTTGSATPFAQMARQGSETDRDVFTCALCAKKFPEMPSLGKHWKEEHKKEASLFQKGMACCECGQEYTNRGGLLRHWKSTHPSLSTSDPGLIVCVICDSKFQDFNWLWAHVEEQHFLEFSSGDFAQQVKEGILGAQIALKCSVCAEEFDTQLELSSHKESCHSGQLCSDVNAIVDSPVTETSSVKVSANGNEASPHKFKCRFCGQKFNLLPDLGRHHQAEHRKPNSKIPISVQVKLPLLAKKTPLPNPATANSPPGKMLPLSEICTSVPLKEVEHRNLVPMTSNAVMTVEWPVQEVVVDPQPQAVNFRHLKTIAREKRKTDEKVETPLVVVGAPPPKRRRRRRKRMESLKSEKLVPMKKKAGGAKQIVEHMRAVKQIQQERYSSNGHVADLGTFEESVKSVSKMPPQRASNTTGWPTSAELLEAARVACCKDSMYRELAKKHSKLHPHLHLQAVSLCIAMRVEIVWQVDGFACPNGCSPYHAMEALVPALEVDMAGFSEAPFKAQADQFTNVETIPLETVNIKDVIRGKRIVMHEDLSNGLEPVPIPCVIDEDVLRPCGCTSCRENAGNPSVDVAEPWKSFSYTNKRLLDPSLGIDTESYKLGCACGEGRCNPARCEHVLMFDNDNAEACDKLGGALKGRFPYDDQGRIILEEGYMVYECNSSCLCREDCQNRVLQKGVRVKLEVFKSRHKGWAVRTAEPIASGTFVCEYIGEVLNNREANKRGVRYDQEGCSYLYDIDAHLDISGSRAGAKPFVIDATEHGNVARFINHSCAPNLVNYEVLVESMDCQLAHIGFFAIRDIAAGEELAYDYRYRLLPGKGCACHCGASTCRGRLY